MEREEEEDIIAGINGYRSAHGICPFMGDFDEYMSQNVRAYIGKSLFREVVENSGWSVEKDGKHTISRYLFNCMAEWAGMSPSNKSSGKSQFRDYFSRDYDLNDKAKKAISGWFGIPLEMVESLDENFKIINIVKNGRAKETDNDRFNIEGNGK